MQRFPERWRKYIPGPVDILSLVENPSSWPRNPGYPRCNVCFSLLSLSVWNQRNPRCGVCLFPLSFSAWHQRCGVCLFPLSQGARPSNVDVEEGRYCDPMRFGRKEVEASAIRGCTFCGNIIKFALRWGAVELFLDQNSTCQRVLLTKSDKSFTSFNFVVRPTGLYQHLPRDLERRLSLIGKHRLCRGLGPIKMKSTADHRVLNQAKLWWETCIRKHNCQGGRISFTPTRLLRLEHRFEDTLIRLVTVAQPVQYVALSHRWCQETEKISLSRSNRLERMERGILSSELPRLMQDTVYVLRRFGIEYIWIDSMCIIQGDHGDWRHEASSMASIYKNATFTISATKSQGSYDSLFSHPTKIATGACIGEVACVGAVRLEEHPAHPFSYIENEEYLGGRGLSLLDRGWVYQEVLLSPRTLYFLHDEVMWRCQEHSVCQCARYDADNANDYSRSIKVHSSKSRIRYLSSGRKRQITSRSWAEIVFDYASRQFTFPKDKLPALAGIAEEFGKKRQWTYLCGLWQEDISQNLIWHRDPVYDPETRPNGTHNLPTWTWASISTPPILIMDQPKTIEFESCDVVYSDEGTSPYLGDVKEAVLTIKGDFFAAKLTQQYVFDHDERTRRSLWKATVKYGVSIMKYFMPLTEDCILDESKLKDSDVLCLAVENEYKDFEGLVLYCVDNNDERYERIGWISSDQKPDWRSWNVVRRQVKLV